MSTLRETTIGEYLDAVSSSASTPGGGSVAAVVAALGASLGSMVTAISAKSEDDRIGELAADCASFRETFLRLSVEDQSAFEAVMSALRLPKEDPERVERVESSVESAAEIPLTVAQTCLDLLAVLESLAMLASRHCVSDVGAAAHFALASLRASLLNVYINITFMKDSDTAAKFDAAALQLEDEGHVRSQRVVDQVIACIRG